MAGRLTKYGDEAYQAILVDLANGIPLAKAIGGKDRPSRTRLFQKIAEDAEFARAYDRARESRAQVRIEKIEDVVEKVLCGQYEPAAAKVALDSLWKLAAKEDPRRYSDVTRAEISGRDGERLIPEAQRLDDLELARMVSWIMHLGTQAAVNQGELVAIESGAQ